MTWLKIIGWIGVTTNGVAGFVFLYFAEDFAEAAIKKKNLVSFAADEETKQLVSGYTKRGIRDLAIAAGLALITVIL